MTVAWVLGGGGAKGSFEVGVLKQLVEKGIVPDAVYGTSVGALNSAGFAYSGIDKLEEAWRTIEGKGDIISFQLGTIVLHTKGVYSTKPLRKLVESVVDINVVPTILPTVSITHIETGELIYINPVNSAAYGMTFADAVVASASMPFIMEPVNEVWVDGGIRETVPLNVAIHDGADEIYVIMCNPWTRDLELVNPVSNWLEVILRLLDIMVHEIFINDIQTCLEMNDDPCKKNVAIHLYAPEHSYTDTLDFSPEKIDYGIAYGYEAKEVGHDFLRAL